MNLSLATLSENTALLPSLLSEYGLSILIETDDCKVLLDTGQGISVVHNAPAMGIDLPTVDKIVLSHGHFDHTGGLRDVLARIKKRVDIIAHPDIWDPKYAGQGLRYIGIPFQKAELEGLGASFVLTKEPIWITDSIVTTGEIPMVTEDEKIDSDLFIKKDNSYIPDPLMDDRAVIIKTAQGLVVVLGCAHRGTINTLRYAQELTGEERIYAIVGGTHLGRSTEIQLETTIAELREMGVQKIGACHCTGLPVACRLAREFREGFFFNNAGTRIGL